jgi:hypothetical protein
VKGNFNAPRHPGSSHGQHDKQSTRETNSVATTKKEHSSLNSIAEHQAAKDSFSGLNTSVDSAKNKDIHPTTCSYCSRAGAKKHCIPCKSVDSKRVIYCSVKCQKHHWKEHKKICVSIPQNTEVFNKRTNEPTTERIDRKDASDKTLNNYKDTDGKQSANPPQAQRIKSPWFTPNTHNSASTQETEYVLKFSFQSTSHTKQDTRLHIAKRHHECLQAMASVSTQVLDTYGAPMPRSSSPPSMSEFEQHFKLYFSPGNKFKNHRPLYTIYHRIRSSMSLGTLCKQSKVSTALKKNNASINLHIWKEDEVDIVNLGFHIGADPCNQLKAHFEADIRSYITARTGTLPDKIPYFQSGFSRPFHNNETGRSVTQSYNLQCRRADANDMIRVLQATFHNDNSMFVFYKIRHTNPAAYKDAIETQNEFLKNRRAIPIHGISEVLMASIEDDIWDLAGIHSIQRHKNTTTTGRWNVLTNIDHFRSLIPQIKRLLTCIQVDKSMLDSSYPQIGLAFNKQTRNMVLKPNQQTLAAVAKGLKTQESLPQSQDTSPDKMQQNLPAPTPWTAPSKPLPNSISSITSAPSSAQDDQYSTSDSNSRQNNSTSVTVPSPENPNLSAKDSNQHPVDSIFHISPNSASSIIRVCDPDQAKQIPKAAPSSHSTLKAPTTSSFRDGHVDPLKHSPVDSAANAATNSASSASSDQASSQTDLETAQQRQTQLKLKIANMTQQIDTFRQQPNTFPMSVPTEIEIQRIITQVVTQVVKSLVNPHLPFLPPLKSSIVEAPSQHFPIAS